MDSLNGRAVPCGWILLASISCLASVIAAPAPEPTLYIQEYRVRGATKIPRPRIEEAVYPFLGPARSTADVEAARAALERLYKESGFETALVEVPAQDGADGIVTLQVTEAAVGRLRVRGSRYFSLAEIKRQAPSMQEGRVPNFQEVTRDIVALNQLADRRVTPTLRAGVTPGTVDIDLTVADTLPLHGSLEVNNRRSAGTTATRVNGAISYQNLWQRGHSMGFSFQLAPERLDDARVFSAFYTARFAGLPGFTLTLQGTRQDSDVSTLGGATVAGRGYVVGLRVGIPLPGGKDFFQSLSLGLDFKDFDQQIRFTTAQLRTPIHYVPLSVNYGAVWTGSGWSTELNLSANLHFRGLGDGEKEFDTKRFRASAGYFYLRGELSHTRDLPGKWQLAARFQGQVASGALLDNEQFSAGGLSTVRGYLESSVLGDNAAVASLELRSPSLAEWLPGKWVRELRFYTFMEGGWVNLHDPLPEQQSRFYLASYGFGLRGKLTSYLSGSLDLGIPLVGQSQTKPNSLLLTFRVSGEF